MKSNLLLTATCIALLSFAGAARTFSAAEAMHAIPSDGNFKLVRTHLNTRAEPSAYVFSKGTDKGFVIMTASGDTPFMLGYTDRGSFNSDSIPPALKVLMEQYARPDIAPSRADKAAIQPLCKTTWGQNSPYNQFCPEHSGKKSLTGCGPTAMAQIMKYHNYPSTGQGQNTYTYQYNYKDYTLSLDFSTVTIDWASMQPSYGSGFGYSDSELAVARLMRYCGIAACSTYSPVETGTQNIKALVAMHKFFKYDASISIEFREWYTDSEWEDLIYSELAERRPVYYQGTSPMNEGHIFVCDGYSSDGYFHINWGWDGSYDGYFLLPALKPGRHDYSYWQRAGVGIRPDAGGCPKVQMYINEIFDTELDSYPRGSNEMINFTGGFFNCTLHTSALEVALKCDTAPAQYLDLASYSQLEPDYGWGTLMLNADKLPVGEYDVYPVFREAGTSEWKPFLHNIDNTDFLHFEVTDTRVKITHTDSPMNSIGTVVADENAPVRYYNLQGQPVANPSGGIFIRVKGSQRSKVRL
ncbi:MAG: C10 family peptidase [Muribaculaceae bacterium]|nr:C10 family peptidase [Muribaculaceae bacterium]